MEIGAIFYDYYGLKNTVVHKFTDLETEFYITRFYSPKGYYDHKIEWVSEIKGDFNNNRKFKSKYLYLKWKNSPY